MICIFGSHGHVLADSSGAVTGFDNRDNHDGSPNDAYGDIARFDLDEWRKHYGRELPGSLDILDIGYWTLDGSYEPAESDHRQMIAEGCGALTANAAVIDMLNPQKG